MLDSSCCCCNFSLPPATCTINYILIGPVCLVVPAACSALVWSGLVCGNLFTIFTLILLTDSAKRNKYKPHTVKTTTWRTSRQSTVCSSSGNTHYACTLLNTSVNFMLLLLLLLPRCASVCLCVCLNIHCKFQLHLRLNWQCQQQQQLSEQQQQYQQHQQQLHDFVFLFFFVVVFWFAHCVGRWSDSIWSQFLAVCGASRLHSLLKSFQFPNERVSRFLT